MGGQVDIEALSLDKELNSGIADKILKMKIFGGRLGLSEKQTQTRW